MEDFVSAAKSVLDDNHDLGRQWCDAKNAKEENKQYTHPEGFLSQKKSNGEKNIASPWR